ncbi:MAG: FAD-dependent oxidoreductase [Opitutales bacterium]|nr:FAD-dependent oxidoreductase [Opitutales bacterium]
MNSSTVVSYRLTNLKLPLDHKESDLRSEVLNFLSLQDDELLDLYVFRRGYDARKKSNIHFIYTLDLQFSADVDVPLLVSKYNLKKTPDMEYKPVFSFEEGNSHSISLGYKRPVVVGTGPCGLFAALTLAQLGLKPLVIERGKAVRERTKDTWGFWRKQIFNQESNVQFGEGGAGTFSDGKLWTQAKDRRHLGRKVMEEMVKGGAPEEILYVSKPHVGTFRLVKIVEYLRGEIERLGGEIRFSHRVENIVVDAGEIQGLETVNLLTGHSSTIDANQVILAVGHSARDTFEMLHARGVFIEPKPFSIGFRIEHPQGVIDRARFGNADRYPLHPGKIVEHVGAADYKLVHHAKNGRSVYSFCMCPGGTVVAATSEAGRVVTNGMSQYSRLERNANAGIVVGIEPEDFGADEKNPLAGIKFQRNLESIAYQLGGENYFAPGQLVGDFLEGRVSQKLGDVIPSYKPGVNLTDLTGTHAPSVLPSYAIKAIQEALPELGKQIEGFDRPDALLTGVETRTSAPIRIRRNIEKDNLAFQSVNTAGLYPAGEGAGYAGGIMSAAIDGIKVAEALAKYYSR